MKAQAYSADGKARSKGVELPESTFDGVVNEAALHQVVTAYLNGLRQGTASTKNRARVRGGGRKPWRQKGTGRARAGTIRSPLWRGGGVVFGPQPRPHSVRVPRKLRRLAIRSALNARAAEGNLVVVDALELEAPRTKAIVELLEKIGEGASNVLILTHGTKRMVHLSARNLPGLLVRPWGEASAYELLWADRIVVEDSALRAEPDTDAVEDTGAAEDDE